MGVVVALCIIGPRFLLGLMEVIAICQEFLVAHALIGEFQLPLRLWQLSGGIQTFPVFVQNLIGIAVLLQPGMTVHFPKQLRFLLRHFPVFPAGPVLRQCQGLIRKGILLFFRQVLPVALVSQKIFRGQQRQSKAAAQCRKQRGGAEGHGNEFQPQGVSHGLASIL